VDAVPVPVDAVPVAVSVPDVVPVSVADVVPVSVPVAVVPDPVEVVPGFVVSPVDDATDV